jgi:hypothetical protein
MQGRWSVPLLRVAGVATCTLQLQLSAVIVAGLAGVVRVQSSLLTFCARSLLLVWAAAAGMTCLRASFIAAQVHDRWGVVQARALALLTPLTLLLIALVADTIAAGRLSRPALIAGSLGACAVAGWSAVFFSVFALVVRRRAFAGE